MNVEEGLVILDRYVSSKLNRHLKDIEVLIIKGAWAGLSYDEIAEREGYAAKYLRQDVGFKLWKLLSLALGEDVNKTNFRSAVERSSRAPVSRRRSARGSVPRKMRLVG